ncbi:MAG: hypothetical protein UV95_C0005G0001 [Candidatus Falkowbacteria bacterium GW2011_GWF2_43_32]|nr:MAG: hypothetical protein UV95_C0005G0001 [Candidatus Falkowbacteria bacterium GW2011_GWF2_43_32]
MKEIVDEFVSRERRKFKWSLGRVVASSLSGFIAGIIVATIFFLTIFNISFK